MLRVGLSLLCLCACVATQNGAQDLEQFHVVYEWYKLDYVWPDDSSKARALTSQRYIPENNAISGVKVYRDRLYLTVPRYKEGVPATLVSIPAASPDKNASPKLEPFPSWAMQELGNCSALQFVQNVEVDTEGRMWVLDTGRVNIMGLSDPKCPPKLVIIDLNSASKTTSYSTHGGPSTPSTSQPGFTTLNMTGTSAKVIRTFQFPDSVVNGLGSYLVDLVLDPTDGWYAYISDGGDADPGIIVYSFLENRAWKVRDNRSMKADPTTRKFSLNGRPTEILQNLSPLAVDLKKMVLYYSPLSSLNLYSLPTGVLRDPTRAGDAPKSVEDVGKKLGLSEGFAMDEKSVLYYGLIDDNGIAKWDTKLPFQENQHIISKDPIRLQWPTNFGFDETGNLWLVTNRMHNYIAGRVNLSEANYRVIRGMTGTKSYLHTEGIGRGDNWGSKPMATAGDSVENNTSRYSADHAHAHMDDVNKGNNTASWVAATPLTLLVGALAARTLA